MGAPNGSGAISSWQKPDCDPLDATNFSSWSLPAGHEITNVTIGIWARWGWGSGYISFGELSHNISPGWVVIPHTGTAWHHYTWNITSFESSWTKAEVDALQIRVCRRYVDEPEEDFLLDAFEIVVTTECTSPPTPTNALATPSTICEGNSSALTASVSDATIYWYTGSCGGTQIGTGNSINVSPTSTTTYYARAYNTCGAWSPGCDTVTVTVDPLLTWYHDADGDGFGDPNDSTQACYQPAGYVADNTDNCPYHYNPGQEDSDSDGIGDACEPPVIEGWESVRTHGNGVGDLAIALDAANPVTESRRYGIQQVEVDFSQAVEAADGSLDVNDVVVTNSVATPYTPASVALTNGDKTLVIGFNSGDLPDQERYTFELAGKFQNKNTPPVVLGGDTDADVRSLVGDVDNSSTVDGADLGIVKADNRQAVSAGNAANDVNVDGKLNLIDLALTKSKLWNTAP